MDGVKMLYNGTSNELVPSKPQYLFLDPYESLVVRYTFKKDGLEEDYINLSHQSLQYDLLKVRAKQTHNKLLLRPTDFNDTQLEAISTFRIDFDNETETVDVLYESHSDKRLRVKVLAKGEYGDSFENENTFTDGPDEYVRLVGVSIKFDGVYYNYLYRREGRLKKHVGKAPWTVLAQIYKSRVFTPNHPDRELPDRSIREAITGSGHMFDYLAKIIYREEGPRRVEMTDGELGQLLREKARVIDILALLRTQDLSGSQHILRLQAESFLQPCDAVCSLQEVTPGTTADERT